jgi:hypothetical protein
VYVSSPSDPVFTVRLTSGWGPNPLNGRRVHLDPRAKPAADSDGHMTIIVPSEDVVISLYQARAPSGGTINATWGGMAPLSGDGANRRDSGGGRESGISQLAGLITPDDVRRGIAAGENGDLGHALGLVHDDVSTRGIVAPAIFSGGNSSSSGALLMGQRVFLDRGVDVASLPCQGDAKAKRFCRLVARTLQRYGAIVVTNSHNFTGFQLTHPVAWTSIGLANPWPELIGPDRGGYYNFAMSAIPHGRMQALAGQGVPGPVQPRLGTVAPGAPGVIAPPPTPVAAPPAASTPRTARPSLRVSRTVTLGLRTVTVRLTMRSAKTMRVRARLRVLPSPGLSATDVRPRDVAVRTVFANRKATLTMTVPRTSSRRVGVAAWVVRPGRDLRVFQQVLPVRPLAR